jgi:hypothetical protein
MKSNFFAFFLSVVLAIFFIEFGYFLFIDKGVYQWEKRYMLFHQHEGGTVFENDGPIFRYRPNALIHSSTYYQVENDWIREYDYEIRTNNWGLVQNNDIQAAKPSIVFLGDSFTEGQGDSPWFNRFHDEFKDSHLQFVNAGLLGTGFAQWGILLDQLNHRQLNVQYLVILFISDDYQRIIWNLSKDSLRCLEDWYECIGYENFYGLPPESEVMPFLNKLKIFREKQNVTKESKLYQFTHSYFPANTLLYAYIANFFGTQVPTPVIYKQSNEAIETFIRRYGDRALFIHIPQKDEVKLNRMNPEGSLARGAIAKVGGRLVDGFKSCGLNELDFYKLDGHPNSRGYEKISECIARSIGVLGFKKIS